VFRGIPTDLDPFLSGDTAKLITSFDHLAGGHVVGTICRREDHAAIVERFAIENGLRRTAGVVTGAALIMTGVFVAFAI
jgi:hypothetical protein